jgi:hypothetical protein
MPFRHIHRTAPALLALISLSGATTVTLPTDARLSSKDFNPGAWIPSSLVKRICFIASSLPGEKNIEAGHLEPSTSLIESNDKLYHGRHLKIGPAVAIPIAKW